MAGGSLINIGLGLNRLTQNGGGTPMPLPGASPTTTALSATVAYHAPSQSGALTKVGNIITACPDLMGAADFSGVSFAGSNVGPIEVTYDTGLKAWRFNSGSYGIIANTLAAFNMRNFTCIMVVRQHRNTMSTFFQPRYQAYTDPSTNTPYTGGGFRSLPTTGCSRLYNATTDSFSDATNGYKMVPGSQLQVIAVSSRLTAGGGSRWSINAFTATGAQNGAATSIACVGGLIGADAGASNAATSNAAFDMVEFKLWAGALTDAQHDATVAAFVANYAIPAITDQYVLDGDSITQGVGTVPSGDSLGMTLTQPGSPMVPPNYRVVNVGVSGDTTVSLTTRRDAVNSIYSKGYFVGGNNINAVQIGRNNWGALAQSGAVAYSNLYPLYFTTSTGYLQRGWSCYAVLNIATGASLQTQCQDQRNLILSSLFADCQAGPGQAFDGKLRLLRADQITVSGQTIFEDATDSGGALYYQGDNTHPTVLGTAMMSSGGDTPANGYGSVV